MTITKPAPRKRKRRPSKGCSVRGCKRRLATAELCNTHLLQKADAAFSRHIRDRDGHCVMCGGTYRLQCCHVISRRYRTIRWNARNAVAGCAKCHTFYTHRPVEWDNWVDGYLGVEVIRTLRWMAVMTDPPDWKELAVECLNLMGGE